MVRRLTNKKLNISQQSTKKIYLSKMNEHPDFWQEAVTGKRGI